MKYKALIFDFNGVLLWDLRWHETAWKKVSEEIRGFPLTDEEIHAHSHGCTNKATITYIKGGEVADDEVLRLTNYKEEIYRQIAVNQSDFCLSPGSIRLLNLLKANKIPFTIATSSEINNVNFFFKNLNLEEWFDFKTVTYDNGTIPGKPAPDMYLIAAEKLGFDPSDCIVIEDATSGIKAAHNAGIGKIIALGPKEKHIELARCEGVGEVIVNLEEIVVKFNELF